MTVPSADIDPPALVVMCGGMPETKPDHMRDTPIVLRERRLALRMTQGQLAGAAGLTRKTVIRAEAGSPVSFETLKAICAVLEIDSSTLPPDPGHNARHVPAGGDDPVPSVGHPSPEDIPEDTHGEVLSIFGFIRELAPSATALAVTDVRTWKQRYYRSRVRSPLITVASTEADLRLLARRDALMFCMGLASLLGPMFAVVIIIGAELQGAPWARNAFNGAIDLVADHTAPLAPAILGAEIGVLLTAGTILAHYFLGTHVKLQSDLEWAWAINDGYQTLCRRFYLAGPDGLRMCDVMDDRSISVTHVTPGMVSACEVVGPSEHPTIRLHMAAGTMYSTTLDTRDRPSHAGRSDPSSYEIPDIADGGKLLRAMGAFDPVRDALHRTRIVRTTGLALTTVTSPA